jgi:hypothetical protein
MAAGSPWDSRQQRWLQAMGYTVLRQGQAEAAGSPAAAVEADPARAVVAEPGSAYPGNAQAAPAPAPRRRAPSLDDAPVRAAAPAARPAPPVAAAPAPRGSLRLPDRLQLAMLRASGLDPSDPAALAEMEQWPVEQLRGNGPAKRAFWPRLRALRRPR